LLIERLLILVVQPQAAVERLLQLAGRVELPGLAAHYQALAINLLGLILAAEAFEQLAGVVVGADVVGVLG